MVDWDLIGNKITDFVSFYGMKVLLGITILIVGWIVINIFTKVIKKRLKKSQKVEVSLENFLGSLISISLKVLLIVVVISVMGVPITSFIAVLGAAGLAIGLALQGSLSNFAGGVLILLLKPFKVGDFIEAQGHMGTVNVINIFNTVLKTPDNKTVILPNGVLSNGNIINYTQEKFRRVDMVFGISYKDDIDKAKKVINDLIKKDKRPIKDSERKPQVVVSKLNDSSVDITVRVWTKTEDYWSFYFDMQENVKKNFDKKKISIPFPQRDVHLHNVK